MTATLFGVDAVALDRVAGLVDRYPDLAQSRIVGPDEAALAAAVGSALEPGGHPAGAGLAVLFAVKEAVIKAVGGRPDGFRWTDVVAVADRPSTPVEAAGILDAFAGQVRPESLGSLGVRLTGSLADPPLAGAAGYGLRDDHVLAAVALWASPSGEEGER